MNVVMPPAVVQQRDKEQGRERCSSSSGSRCFRAELAGAQCDLRGLAAGSGAAAGAGAAAAGERVVRA